MWTPCVHAVQGSQRYCILCHSRLACAGVGSHEDRFALRRLSTQQCGGVGWSCTPRVHAVQVRWRERMFCHSHTLLMLVWAAKTNLPCMRRDAAFMRQDWR